MDYRLFYQEKTGVIVPDHFDIHHIDEDRENNNIENLVAIPKATHKNFHKYRLPNGICIDCRPRSITIPGREAIHATSIALKMFLPYYTDVCRWIDYRDYLLGEIPNIHRISYIDA